MKEYKIKEYIDELKKYDLINEVIKCQEIDDRIISSMTYNSNEVEPDSLFICKGDNFKVNYLEAAIDFGAVAYVSEVKYDVLLPCILVKNIRKALSILPQMYFNYPKEKLNVIGITGTKGKSTTAFYTKYILDEMANDNLKKDTAIISTITTYDGIVNEESHITTPESFDLQRHFSNAVKSNIENVVMEVSSQSFSKKYGRLYNVTFDIGVFLNISEDHISPIEHPTFEDYFECKLRLFENTNIACVNLDSAFSNTIYETAKRNSKSIVTFSLKDKTADIYGYDILLEEGKISFSVKTNRFDRRFELNMPGKFNIENALAAIAIAYAMGVPDRYIYLGLKKAKTNGRMEIYKSEDKKIVSIVDYAHNKLSFEKVYESVKHEYNERKIIVVFGCPGSKAQIRRRDLGKVAGKYSDKIYITEDDPAFESVIAISNEIAKYVKEYTNNYEIIEDRQNAIKEAINYAASISYNSIVLVLGKGNDATQKVGREYVPYKTDSYYVKEYLKQYDKQKQSGVDI